MLKSLEPKDHPRIKKHMITRVRKAPFSSAMPNFWLPYGASEIYDISEDGAAYDKEPQMWSMLI